MAKQSVTKAEHRDLELQSSELRGNKNDLSAQLQIQLIGFGTKSVPRFLLKVSRFKKKWFFRFFWGLSGGGRCGFYKKLCTRVLRGRVVEWLLQPLWQTLAEWLRQPLWQSG